MWSSQSACRPGWRSGTPGTHPCCEGAAPHHVTSMRLAPIAVMTTQRRSTSRTRMSQANHQGAAPSTMIATMDDLMNRSTVGSYILPKLDVWSKRRRSRRDSAPNVPAGTSPPWCVTPEQQPQEQWDAGQANGRDDVGQRASGRRPGQALLVGVGAMDQVMIVAAHRRRAYAPPPTTSRYDSYDRRDPQHCSPHHRGDLPGDSCGDDESWRS
jgi:hypothetical protein